MSENTEEVENKDANNEGQIDVEEQENIELSAVNENSEDQEDSKYDQLKQDLEKSQKDYLYLRADFDNYRKKMIEERSQWKKYGSEAVLRELIGIIDNFDLALQTEVTAENLESFQQGVQMIRHEITSSLERAGVVELSSMGEAFNPTLHEALGAEESTEVEDGHILREFKKAFKLHDRLLRPGQVIVAKKPAQ